MTKGSGVQIPRPLFCLINNKREPFLSFIAFIPPKPLPMVDQRNIVGDQRETRWKTVARAGGLTTYQPAGKLFLDRRVTPCE